MGKGVLCITLVSAIPQVKISSPVVLTRCTQSIFTRELVAREGPGGGGGGGGGGQQVSQCTAGGSWYKVNQTNMNNMSLRGQLCLA